MEEILLAYREWKDNSFENVKKTYTDLQKLQLIKPSFLCFKFSQNLSNKVIFHALVFFFLKNILPLLSSTIGIHLCRM